MKKINKGGSSGRSLGDRITLGRINKAMDRAMLARLTGIEYQRLYNIERGIITPTGIEYHAIFKAIGTTSATHIYRKYERNQGANV